MNKPCHSNLRQQCFQHAACSLIKKKIFCLSCLCQLDRAPRKKYGLTFFVYIECIILKHPLWIWDKQDCLLHKLYVAIDGNYLYLRIWVDYVLEMLNWIYMHKVISITLKNMIKLTKHDTHSLIVSTFFRIVGPRTRIGTEIQTTAGRKRSQITLTRS